MEIRAEIEQDRDAIFALNRDAFDTTIEADLVDTLRLQADPHISLVAEDGDAIIGHIMFSPATLSADAGLRILGLAPMAVVPERQREGIGGTLLRAGLEACRKLDYRAVFVLGHPRYYPRFGFVPASRYGISSNYDVPDEAFMALELVPGVLNDKAGKMHYHRAFDGL